jgi:hypothetical protein
LFSERAVAYIDTLKILLRRPLGTPEMHRLRQLVGRPLFQFRTTLPRWPFRLLLPQPSRAVCAFIAANCPGHIVGRVDLAVDFITPTAWEARSDAHWLARHVVQAGQRSPRSRMRKFKGTKYWAPSTARRGIRLYSDLPSKITGEPCAHVEIIRARAALCRSVGLATSKDFLADDLPAKLAGWWRRDVALYRVGDAERLDADVEADRIERRLTEIETARRLFGEPVEERPSRAPVQRLRDVFPLVRWGGLLEAISLDGLPKIEFGDALINVETPTEAPSHKAQIPSRRLGSIQDFPPNETPFPTCNGTAPHLDSARLGRTKKSGRITEQDGGRTEHADVTQEGNAGADRLAFVAGKRDRASIRPQTRCWFHEKAPRRRRTPLRAGEDSQGGGR